MKTLTINGAGQQLSAGTVAGMVEELGLPGPLVLVELNGLALRKSEWGETPLRDGDRIEILRIAAGG
ncbi:MAG: sulfur carrier protein ThiS [Verrucomicrobia bacterium]|nr:sulfur carrier protein ThiS [Verrucomicrobiota bacterium]